MQRVLVVCAVLLLGISGVARDSRSSIPVIQVLTRQARPPSPRLIRTTVTHLLLPSTILPVVDRSPQVARHSLRWCLRTVFSPARAITTAMATHLASWGYIVAMPDFPSEIAEDRATDVQYLLSYLEAEDANPASMFYGRIAVNRLGVVGHSLGGATTLMVAARDSRIKAAVALDPGILPSALDTPWDYQQEAPMIKAPTAVLVSPPDAVAPQVAMTCTLRWGLITRPIG